MVKDSFRTVLLKNKPPIILVPGIGFDYAMWNWKRILEEKGYLVKIAKLYSTFVSFKTIHEQAVILGKVVDDLLKDSDKTKCNLIGFSMGSIVSLYYLQNMDGYKKVDKCICAIGPFLGIRRYLLLLASLTSLVRSLPEIFPRSSLLQGMINFGELKDVKVYTLRGQYDMLCSEKSGRLPFAKNLDPLPTGHAGIYFAFNLEAIKHMLKILKK